jgi:hypothetical protein
MGAAVEASGAPAGCVAAKAESDAWFMNQAMTVNKTSVMWGGVRAFQGPSSAQTSRKAKKTKPP